ncbi:MAG: hypothetical protein WDO13_02345 [Verrucomicrobiota bacterium]
MRRIYWLTLLLLGVGIGLLGKASSIVAPAYHQSLVWNVAMLSVPSLIIAVLAVAWRKSAPKSAVLLVISALMLGAIYLNCQPIFQAPDDLVFPFMGLVPADLMIFLWLILMLIAVHFAEELYRRRPVR